MKHCTLPTLLAVKTTILPTVPARPKTAKTLRLVSVYSFWSLSGKKSS